ncbi:hypothetical protein K7432_012587 [Basidiobolus ranarum]|uniref:Uncharacterized protein n=1 Tax=Basidiobolus ranarum TaxID=34480 RepID=A0ABR2WKL1_9FUNG
MSLKVTLISAILLASVTNAADNQLSTPADHTVELSAPNFLLGEKLIVGAGTYFIIPDIMLDKEVELTPEESQMRRTILRKILSRLSKTSGVKKLGKLVTEMPLETDDQSASTSVSPNVDSAGNNDVDYSVHGERDIDLDTSPEETELRRGGRGGRGRGHGRGRGGRGRGRGRFGRGHGRFGRGRFGRGGRFDRFGGRGFGRFARFGRFGYGGYGWNDDCGGDDCGSC